MLSSNVRKYRTTSRVLIEQKYTGCLKKNETHINAEVIQIPTD